MQTKRIAVMLPGLGRIQRGAETAFLEISRELDNFPDVDVTLFGSGNDVPGTIPIEVVECRDRKLFERWPKLPVFRSECHYEEATFVRNLWREKAFDPFVFDAVIHCTYPFVNWYVQRAQKKNPDLKSLFVTQNGDWMCRSDDREYRFFKCDGLVTINPDYFEANQDRYNTRLIPNGTDTSVFFPARSQDKSTIDQLQDIPTDKTIVLMVSALAESKRVREGVEAVSRVPDAFLLVAGDGPERDTISQVAETLMPGRFKLLGSVHRSLMPEINRAADIFLHMSKTEPFGIVYLEAAASGLPIITHDWDTPQWILDDTAVLVDTDDPPAIAASVEALSNPDFGKQLGEKARLRVTKDWTWKVQATKYRSFLDELIGQNSRETEENDVVDHHRQLQHA